MGHLIKTADLVVPVFLLIVLGYIAGRRGIFAGDGAVALNHLVIGFALPATLFVGTVAETRSALAQQLPLFGLLTVGLLGLDLVVLVVFRYVFRQELHLSVLLALAATQPMFAFMGIPVLTGVLGRAQAALDSGAFPPAERRILLTSTNSAVPEVAPRLKGIGWPQ